MLVAKVNQINMFFNLKPCSELRKKTFIVIASRNTLNTLKLLIGLSCQQALRFPVVLACMVEDKHCLHYNICLTSHTYL